jgi:hypothetical protein
MLGPPLLPRNLEASIRDLSSTKPDVRASAIEDLVRHARNDADVRDQAVPLLKQRLTDEHSRVRAAAAVALGDLEATDAVTALLVAVEDDNAYVRQMAINALGEIGDERALPRLRRALKDSRPEVRYQTIIAFARVADQGRSCEGEAGAPPHREWVPADEVDDALFEAARDEDHAVAHIALRVAEERLDRGCPPDGRLVARARALVVGPHEGEAASELMLVAAILLAKAGDPVGHDIILRVVRGEKVNGKAADKEDERAAVELVGQLALTAATTHLERRVWGAMRFVRDTCSFHARIALARMGHERATKEILAELDSPRREVIEGAVVSAGRARLREAKGTIARFTAAAVDPALTREALRELDAEETRPCAYRTAPPSQGRRPGDKPS